MILELEYLWITSSICRLSIFKGNLEHVPPYSAISILAAIFLRHDG